MTTGENLFLQGKIDEAYKALQDELTGRNCYLLGLILREGLGHQKADEEKAMEIIMNEMNSEDNPLDDDQQKQSDETLLPLMETENGPFLTMKEETWQTLIDWMLENKLIAKSVTPADVETSPTLG